MNTEQTFTVTKDIRANGRRWDRLISGMAQDYGQFTHHNLFTKKAVRRAWEELEKRFSDETVVAMIDRINRFTHDGEDRIEVKTLSDNSVEVRFYPDKFDGSSLGRNDFYDGIVVVYTDNGFLDEPERYTA